MQPFPTDEVVSELAERVGVPYWTGRTLYPRKFGSTLGDQSTPEAGSFIYTGAVPSPEKVIGGGASSIFDLPDANTVDGPYSFKPTPIGASLLNSLRTKTGKTILPQPITLERRKALNIPPSAAGFYIVGDKDFGHANPTTRAVYLDPQSGANSFVLAHEAGHAVDPELLAASTLIKSQLPAAIKASEKSAARKDPYTFLSSFMQGPLQSASNEAFAQRFAVDKLNAIGVDTTGVLRDDWYKEYPASKVVEGLDNARDVYVYNRTGANPHRPMREISTNAFVDDRNQVADQFLNLALDKRYQEQQELLRQRGRQDIDRTLGPYANVD